MTAETVRIGGSMTKTESPTLDTGAEHEGPREQVQADTSSGPIAGVVQTLRAIPHVGVWLGILITGVGAGLVIFAWAETAAQTAVALQLPYVVSAGFTGVAIVVVGLTIVQIATKDEAARERSRQILELSAQVAALRRIVEGDDAA
jgi:hypothetical protein